MRHLIFTKLTVVIVLMAITLQSCQDNCTQTTRFRTTVNRFISFDALSRGVQLLNAQPLQNPGKIYIKDNYLFINEVRKGVHIIDNTDPKNPVVVNFLQIIGNSDIAIKGNTLYADSYTDLVTLDISDIKNIKEVTRTSGVFQNGQIDGLWWNISQGGINDTDWEYRTRVTQTTCENVDQNRWWVSVSDGGRFFAAASPSSTPSGTGVAGSMARFAIVSNYLYTISNSDMTLFDIQSPQAPKSRNKINMGWGIETIFPYKDKLFIGSTTGMFIYENKNPEKPFLLSQVNHFRACDPVVVQDNYAYVTLRSANNGVRCDGDVDQLDVIDITNVTSPVLSKVYPMESPYGLGIDKNDLFICEGKSGLKRYNASKPLDLQLTQHIKDMDSYDVIPLGKTLLMIGKDGLYQYDYSDPKNLKQLSVIKVQRVI